MGMLIVPGLLTDCHLFYSIVSNVGSLLLTYTCTELCDLFGSAVVLHNVSVLRMRHKTIASY